jgi:hypothetical protein
MKPYISVRLEAASISAYTDATKAIITNVNQFLRVLVQSYGDLDEIRTSELQLIKLKQNTSVPEYLIRFT